MWILRGKTASGRRLRLALSHQDPQAIIQEYLEIFAFIELSSLAIGLEIHELGAREAVQREVVFADASEKHRRRKVVRRRGRLGIADLRERSPQSHLVQLHLFD